MHLLSFILFSLSAFSPSLLGAQEPIPSPHEEVVPSAEPLPSFGPLLMKTIFLLIFVLVFLFSMVWILRRLQSSYYFKSNIKGDRHIEMIERSYLSPKTVVWYAKIDGVPCVLMEGQHGVAISQMATKNDVSRGDV